MGDVAHFASKWDSVAPKIAYGLTLNVNIAFVSLKYYYTGPFQAKKKDFYQLHFECAKIQIGMLDLPYAFPKPRGETLSK